MACLYLFAEMLQFNVIFFVFMEAFRCLVSKSLKLLGVELRPRLKLGDPLEQLLVILLGMS